MSAPSPKKYQRDAVDSALAIFRHAESQIQAAPDEDSRRTATAFNGCVLLEAPTGAGKTLMAGMIAEAFSGPGDPHNARIVWFWFTPFGNLVDQAKGALKADFAGLRMRDLSSERVAYAARSGDVFVTTWASVAARKAETRKLRTSGDYSLSLDEFIPELRQADFRIGVVVDEAHHGFTAATEAVRFYREVMRPDFTLLITATPDDADIERFKKAGGIGELHRIRVSRLDAVRAGLIKGGVTSVAYLASADQKARADIPATALAGGWQIHNAIKTALAEVGVHFMPLMLVQVGDSGKSGNNAIQDAKNKLLALGVPEDAIAWYTADEPNDDLLAVALDETKQVLIFKMAVALGFDAPRAFTVVSLRGARDTGFGLQVVGRILRVHRKLQPKVLDNTLPDLLRFGYVFLAEAESQSGLISAGERINAIRTEMSRISAYTMVVHVGEETQVQYSRDGQPSLLPQPYVPLEWKPARETISEDEPARGRHGSDIGDLFSGYGSGEPLGNHSKATVPASRPFIALPGNVAYSLREGMPQPFKTERSPLSTDDLVKCVNARVNLSAEVLKVGLSKSVKVTRKTITDIFDAPQEIVDTVQAKLSHAELARRAQNVLFDAGHISPKELEDGLLSRLRLEYSNYDLSDDEVRRSMNLILGAFPSLIREAVRTCTARAKEIHDAASLPPQLEMPPDAPRSRLNVYGVMPQDLNEPERKFAELLDSDTSGTVLWWHRNEPSKPWSIGIVLPTGKRYFPDFTVGVKDRTRGAGILLAEIKGDHILHHEREKVVAEHKIYGSPVMLTQRNNGKFWIVKYIERADRVEEDQVFRVEYMAQY